MGRVVVAGAINTDLVATVRRAPNAGETVTGTSFAMFGGGKGANQAVAARRSGAEVTMVGALGDDAFGRERRAELQEYGIDLDAVVTIPDFASGVALIQVETGGENRITYVPGSTLAITATTVTAALQRLRPAVYLQPNEVPFDAAAAALAVAEDIGALRILNAAPDPESVVPLLAHVDLLIVNAGEARAISDWSGDEPHGLANGIRHRYGIDSIVTAGAAGAYAAIGAEAVRISAPAIEVVDTTGAGDAFCGALAARLADGSATIDAIRWAVHAGALACTVAGAQTSIPTSAEIVASLGV